jgi:predicted RNase H-like nuclease (RuvC/YqgF family)
MSDMSMDEMIEVLARYRYNAKHDADRIKALEDESSRLRGDIDRLRDRYGEATQELSRLRASSFVTAVPVEEYEKLKAEVERLQSIHSIDSIGIEQLKAEVERLTKAGDLICRMAGNNQVINRHWKTAKKGVQS